ncbi:MAG TPA: hypothetical protein VMW19_03135 [Myxococcota bacterium]|nr:hypothetical protein [Myxococcota bacterium]
MKTTFDDSVAVIRMERGRGNAIDDGFVAELNGALDEVEASDARAAVVTGAGADRSGRLADPLADGGGAAGRIDPR